MSLYSKDFIGKLVKGKANLYDLCMQLDKTNIGHINSTVIVLI